MKENYFDCSEIGYKYENILTSISIVSMHIPVHLVSMFSH